MVCSETACLDANQDGTGCKLIQILPRKRHCNSMDCLVKTMSPSQTEPANPARDTVYCRLSRPPAKSLLSAWAGITLPVGARCQLRSTWSCTYCILSCTTAGAAVPLLPATTQPLSKKRIDSCAAATHPDAGTTPYAVLLAAASCHAILSIGGRLNCHCVGLESAGHYFSRAISDLVTLYLPHLRLLLVLRPAWAAC